MMATQTDTESFLRFLHQPGDVFEIRALGVGGKKKRTDSGFFDDPAKAAECALRLDKTLTPRGIYVTLNPLQPAMLARAANRIQDWATSTAGDQHVLRRRWLPIDVDPIRAGGVTDIAATDDEVRAAWDVAENARNFLMGMGFDEPAEANSGNGRLLLFPVDLPNDQTSADLLKRVLLSVKQKTETPDATIDLTMFNASRIIRLMGTWNRKGDDLPTRPHRISTFDYKPDDLRKDSRQ